MSRIDSDDWVSIILIGGLIIFGIVSCIFTSISDITVKTACINQGGTYKSGVCSIDSSNKQ